MSESWRFRINIAIVVGAIAVALHMLGIGSPYPAFEIEQ
jgi:hypothetical protein